ncbi:MAG: asparagine synthase (glutamine-hydrolyzing) [Deltaproteobacteria bacterium]|nr:asparagine synthase (glutamine-hydrolyzing) [Deltaproteobacteria bacterium]
MCGISAMVTADPLAMEAVERMVAALAHRGPDARAIRSLPGCCLGHTRLSIIDLATGRQPMGDPEGRYWITFNGEIYNYREIRRLLQEQGQRFRTTSDTEVILAAYARWGAAGLDRFRGMFAFAIWDQEARRLFAARDIFGEKPFYYACTPEGALLLASEIKALLASELLRPRLDLNTVDAYLALGYVPPDRTIYSNVQTLPPGHYLEWQDGRLRIERYWQPQLQEEPITLPEAGVRLAELLEQAVTRQMVADVPVGAFLSGGLDSSTIVALMQKQSPRPVKTFSVGFGSLINELPYARAVADRHGTEHHEIDLGTPPVAELLERMASVYDEPFADSAQLPNYLISEFARQTVKVVLSGDGGDELFGGYWWYPPLALSGKKSPSRLKWLILRTISKLLQDKVRKLFLHSAAQGMAARWPDMWTRDVMTQTYLRKPERTALWAERAPEVSAYAPGLYYRPPASTRGLNQGFYFDLTCYLPGDILVKVDRAAMAHGLEIRAPLLDRDLVEFALSLPASLKVEDDQTKIVFREACKGYWPPELLTRGKLGFGAPYRHWLSRPDMQDLKKHVFAGDSPLSRLLPGLSPESAGKNSYQTWILLVLGIWLERHHTGEG